MVPQQIVILQELFYTTHQKTDSYYSKTDVSTKLLFLNP